MLMSLCLDIQYHPIGGITLVFVIMNASVIPSILAPIAASIHNPLLDLPICLIQVVVHDNLIVHTLLLRKRHLRICLLQPLLYRILAIRAPPS